MEQCEDSQKFPLPVGIPILREHLGNRPAEGFQESRPQHVSFESVGAFVLGDGVDEDSQAIFGIVGPSDGQIDAKMRLPDAGSTAKPCSRRALASWRHTWSTSGGLAIDAESCQREIPAKTPPTFRVASRHRFGISQVSLQAIGSIVVVVRNRRMLDRTHDRHILFARERTRR